MDLQDLVPVAIAFVVVGIVLAFGLSIQNSMRTDDADYGVTANCNLNSTGGTGGVIRYEACGADYNATVSAQGAVANVADKLPLLGLVIAAAIIIGVLLKSFRGN